MYTLYTNPSPTIAQLKARRLECLTFALAMHRRILRAHPDANVIDWQHARRYWTEQAYHAHGEVIRIQQDQRINDILARHVWR